jgi:glycosyl-4,4'-diaponeurosporenoate acyltransferase
VILPLSDGWSVAVSSVFWTLSSLLLGWIAHRWGLERVESEGPLTRLRDWEAEGRWWQRHLRVRRWKDRLPEAGGFFRGGYPKRRLRSRQSSDLDRFRRETIRAERVHWALMASSPLHLIWCRPPIGAGMLAFGVCFNAPFIVVQRFNRGRISRLLRRRTQSLTATDPVAEAGS